MQKRRRNGLGWGRTPFDKGKKVRGGSLELWKQRTHQEMFKDSTLDRRFRRVTKEKRHEIRRVFQISASEKMKFAGDGSNRWILQIEKDHHWRRKRVEGTESEVQQMAGVGLKEVTFGMHTLPAVGKLSRYLDRVFNRTGSIGV